MNLLIDNTTASNGQEIDTQKLEDLPNLGRNPILFAKLSTNVAAVGDPALTGFRTRAALRRSSWWRAGARQQLPGRRHSHHRP